MSSVGCINKSSPLVLPSDVNINAPLKECLHYSVMAPTCTQMKTRVTITVLTCDLCPLVKEFDDRIIFA